jgi:hypothetical protein
MISMACGVEAADGIDRGESGSRLQMIRAMLGGSMRQGRQSTKFANSCNPAAALFSGWN